MVAPYPPTPPLSGGRRRIVEELRTLGQGNTIDLCCLTFDDDEDAQLSRINLPNVRIHSVRHRWRDAQPRSGALPEPAEKFWNADLKRCVDGLADSHSYDWVLAEHCYASPYVHDLPMRKVLTEHNVEYRIFEQMASADDDLSLPLALCGTAGELFHDVAGQLASLREFEQSSWMTMDLCLSVSDVERQIMKATCNRYVHLAPNCPDASTRSELPTGQPRIAFIGALNYFPNVDAVVYLLRAVLPRIRRVIPDIEVIVAGRDPIPQMVDFCGANEVPVIANPDSIDAMLTSATVLACPLRFGAGTRIKVLDAMARGIPVVASSLAMEGLGGSAGREFLVGDEPREFSDQLTEVLMSYSLRRSISEAASTHLSMLDLSWGKVFDDVERRLAGFSPSKTV